MKVYLVESTSWYDYEEQHVGVEEVYATKEKAFEYIKEEVDNLITRDGFELIEYNKNDGYWYLQNEKQNDNYEYRIIVKGVIQ